MKKNKLSFAILFVAGMFLVFANTTSGVDTYITITGTGFLSATGVTVGGATATINSNNATTINATLPTGTGAGAVLVTNDAGVSNNLVYYFYTAPTISNLNPAHGGTDGNTTVTITGTGFPTGLILGDKLGVTFNGTSALSANCTNSTTIIATSPVEPAGTVYIYVTTPAGGSTNGSSSNYTYEDAATVTSVSPDHP